VEQRIAPDSYKVAAMRAYAANVYAFWRGLRDSRMPPHEALACTVALIRSIGEYAQRNPDDEKEDK
jgi:hypothetical protein